MEWVMDEVLDSGVTPLPGPMSGEEEEVFPVAGLTAFPIQQQQDGRQQSLKRISTF